MVTWPSGRAATTAPLDGFVLSTDRLDWMVTAVEADSDVCAPEPDVAAVTAI